MLWPDKEKDRMFTHQSSVSAREVLKGIELRTLAWGQNTLLAQFNLKKETLIPNHSHPHEQTGYLVSGRLRLTVDGSSYEAAPGDSWCIPSGVPHGAEALEESVAIEVFSPVREDYLPK